MMRVVSSDQQQADAVDADRVVDVEAGNPGVQFGELKAGAGASKPTSSGMVARAVRVVTPRVHSAGELFAADEQQHRPADQREEDQQAEQGKSPADL